MYYALVNTAIGAMYTDSSANAAHTDEVLYGMCVEVLEQDIVSGRSHIRTHYQYEGWIPSAYLYPANSVIRDWELAANVWLRHPYADILSAPKIQSRPLMSLVRGARLCATSQADDAGWVRVRLLDGRDGYIRQSFLMPYVAPRSVKDLDEETFRQSVTAAAKEYLGTQYRWGGKSPLGIDCSGLCSTAYMQNGILIYRDAVLKEGFPVHPIDRKDVKPGDLFYFPGHIAMSLGGDLFIHSTSKGGYYGVVINSFDPSHPHYRPDLRNSLTACGSIF